MKPESLIANASTDKPKGCSIVFRCITERPYISYAEISKATGLKIPTVVARLNDLLYIHQVIVQDGSCNGSALYRPRMDEPAAQRPESKVERLERENKELKAIIAAHADAMIFKG